MKKPTGDDKDEPVMQMLKIVDLIDCAAGNAPDRNGQPISIVTFAHLGELEQPLALSYADTKTLVTKLLGSLADHGNDYAEYLLDTYFTDKPSKSSGVPTDSDDEADDEEGESWKKGPPS